MREGKPESGKSTFILHLLRRLSKKEGQRREVPVEGIDVSSTTLTNRISEKRSGYFGSEGRSLGVRDLTSTHLSTLPVRRSRDSGESND